MKKFDLIKHVVRPDYNAITVCKLRCSLWNSFSTILSCRIVQFSSLKVIFVDYSEEEAFVEVVTNWTVSEQTKVTSSF